MGSIAPPSLPSTLPLVPAEKIGPAGWIRYLYVFQLAEDYDPSYIESLIRTALEAAKERTPVLGYEAIPDPSSTQGALHLRKYAADEIDNFKVKDLRSSFPHYSELKAKRFPVSYFDKDVVCLRSEWPQAGDRWPTYWMQVNFIPGGLVLNWMLFHAYSDGNTSFKFTEILAEEVRRAQGIPITQPCEVPYDGRLKVIADSGVESSFEQHAEYMVLPFTPTGMPPKLLSDIHVGRVFYFSPQALAELKAEAQPANATALTDVTSRPKYTSLNDAIAALIWRAVMKAQHPLEDLKDDENPLSVNAVSLDTRLRSRLGIHKNTIGNFVGFAMGQMTLRDLVSKASLADIAIELRKAVATTDNYMDEITSLVPKLDVVHNMVAKCFLDMPGLANLTTTWKDFDLYGLDWGHALGGKMRSVRIPEVGVCHCLQIVLPPTPEGGLEVFVGVERSAFGRFLADKQWLKYAQPI